MSRTSTTGPSGAGAESSGASRAAGAARAVAGADGTFAARAEALLGGLRQSGQYKALRVLESAMGPTVEVRGYGRCLCFCSNDYLGLAAHPEVVEAGERGLERYGAGTAGVRFICGTLEAHEELEARLAELMGTEAAYTFVSCWNANEALFPTLCEPGDVIISDELNHASIIDSIRLATALKKGVGKAVYRHADAGDLRRKLEEARSGALGGGGADGASGNGAGRSGAGGVNRGVVWVVTDGVFSMEGDIADLPALRRVCDEFGAVLVVDDSHGHGVMGRTGRGTHEHWGMVGDGDGGSSVGPGRVDLFTGTLGKALGGGAGGFVAGPRDAIDLLVQRGRPTLFSNALPATVACSAARAVEVLRREPERVERLRANAALARQKIRGLGLEVIESPTAICPIIVHDTARAIAMSQRLLELGVLVIGFGYPVVPEGHARLRVQVSAAHTHEHIEGLVAALAKL
ncbi:MAG TPA: aminotransferase class I/II-fold pyridoxal phosphate-dependent enzyme [Phycisphaerales bacterium]|nr:aminotransferase class I/II-fold pyridoxal phosphate-dependent enzyme [Phycisphaerales bacterium]